MWLHQVAEGGMRQIQGAGLKLVCDLELLRGGCSQPKGDQQEQELHWLKDTGFLWANNAEINKPKRGGAKKFYVYVKDGDKVKKVSFGAKDGGSNLSVKLKNPKARKAFADRHNCDTANDKLSARYWSCRLPYYAKDLGLTGGGNFFW